MAGKSNIEWTDATVNFWWGCTKVGPGCDHCYAETWDKRTGGSHWGMDVPRRKIAGAAKLIHRLDNQYADWAADAECARGNAAAFGLPIPNMANRRRVFIQSMSDLFDLEVPLEWFTEAWGLIEVCNRIDVQIVTKRISAVEKRLAAAGITVWPRHAGLMVTVVNQEEADRDVPRLLALKVKLDIPWVGLSIEPMLGPIDFNALSDGPENLNALTGLRENPFGTIVSRRYASKIDWVIVGGESGKDARPMHPAWARSLRDQCATAGVPFFFKQWGEWADAENYSSEEQESYDVRGLTADGVIRVGKAKAGRLLDGVEHNAMPEVTR